VLIEIPGIALHCVRAKKEATTTIVHRPPPTSDTHGTAQVKTIH